MTLNSVDSALVVESFLMDCFQLSVQLLDLYIFLDVSLFLEDIRAFSDSDMLTNAVYYHCLHRPVSSL